MPESVWIRNALVGIFETIFHSTLVSLTMYIAMDEFRTFSTYAHNIGESDSYNLFLRMNGISHTNHRCKYVENVLGWCCSLSSNFRYVYTHMHIRIYFTYISGYGREIRWMRWIARWWESLNIGVESSDHPKMSTHVTKGDRYWQWNMMSTSEKC